jgi:Zn finger protein HypA/HybF involved in hydrogenase expression
MHEASLATSVLEVLRNHPGPHDRVRVHIADISSTPEELTRQLESYLASADPPVNVCNLEVVPRARERLCASCAATWLTFDHDPTCPACGGVPLPTPHDHRLEVELLG